MSNALYMVKQDHAEVEVYRDGELVLKLDFNDTSELAAMLTRAAELVRDAIDEDMADMRAEQESYFESARRMDNIAELRYDRNGWN